MYKPDKATTERNAKILRELVKQPDNKLCADCKRNGAHLTRLFFSLSPHGMHQILGGHHGTCEDSLRTFCAQAHCISSGVYLCIRCSGFHRGMGTHISRVKSIDLDMWTPEQMEVVTTLCPPIRTTAHTLAVHPEMGQPPCKHLLGSPSQSRSYPSRPVSLSYSEHFPSDPISAVKWNRSFARSTNRVDGPWRVLPPRIHPSSSPLPTRMRHRPPRPHRSLTRRLPIPHTHPPPVSPHPALPRLPSTPPAPFAKTPSTLPPNPDNSSPPPSLDGFRSPLRHSNPSLNSNYHHSNSHRNPKTTSSRSTFTHPPSRNQPRHPNHPPKTSNKTFSPSFPRRHHQPPRRSLSSPRTRLVSLRRPNRLGTYSVATCTRHHKLKHNSRSA